MNWLVHAINIYWAHENKIKQRVESRILRHDGMEQPLFQNLKKFT